MKLSRPTMPHRRTKHATRLRLQAPHRCLRAVGHFLCSVKPGEGHYFIGWQVQVSNFLDQEIEIRW
jgi:hypothetical protein